MAAPDASNASPGPAGGTWSERNYRALKIAVIVMGALIVLGLIVVFATIVNRLSTGAAPADAPPVAVVLPQDIAVLFGPDAEVVSTALDGSRLAVVLKRPEGHTVVVVDLRAGSILSVIGPGVSR